jgi:hypothetical protein
MPMMLKTIPSVKCELPEFTEEEMREMNDLFEDTFAMLMNPYGQGAEPLIQEETEFTPIVFPGTRLYTINE